MCMRADAGGAERGKEREKEKVCVWYTPPTKPQPTTTTQTNNKTITTKKQAALLAAQQWLGAATPALLERMALYLDHNSATRAILFKPVRLRVRAVSCVVVEAFVPLHIYMYVCRYIHIYRTPTQQKREGFCVLTNTPQPTQQTNLNQTQTPQKQVLDTLAQLKELLTLALAVATHPQPATTTAPFLLPPSIDGPLAAMRAALTRALDGGGGELLDASASGSLSSVSSAGTGGGAGGDAVGPRRAAQTAGGGGGLVVS